MAAGIAGKAAPPDTAALAAQAMDLERQIAERDEALGWMREQMAGMEAAHAQRTAPAPEPATKAAPDPAAAAREREAAAVTALSLLAKSGTYAASRRTWLDGIDALGRHLAPDAPPVQQRAAALADERGRDLLDALQKTRR